MITPFTIFHLGPAIILGYPIKSTIHWPTLIITSLIVDVEPLLVIIFGLTYPLHGYLHTFIAGVVLGSLLGILMWLFKDLNNLFKTLLLVTKDEYPLSSYVIAGITGWELHVLLDSPLYSDIRPLYPLTTNPLYNPSMNLLINKLCIYLTIIGITIYLIHLLTTSLRKVLNHKTS